MKKVVFSDVFDINVRIKDIDSSYTVLYDDNTQDYLLYSNGVYQLNLGNALDARVLDKIYSTRVTDAYQIFNDIEQHNLDIENHNKEKLKYENSYMFRQIFNYANSHSKQTNNFTQTNWV